VEVEEVDACAGLCWPRIW